MSEKWKERYAKVEAGVDVALRTLAKWPFTAGIIMVIVLIWVYAIVS